MGAESVPRASMQNVAATQLAVGSGTEGIKRGPAHFADVDRHVRGHVAAHPDFRETDDLGEA